MNVRAKIIGFFVLAVCVHSVQAQSQNLWQPWYITPRAGDQHVDLNGPWQLSYMDTTIASLDELQKSKEQFETQIPNSVHWSLYKAGKLPHPYYHKNSEQYRWTDEKAWYYTKTFETPVSVNDHYVFLCFDGVDYFSKVWLNDTLLGNHEGMFGGPNIEVSRLLKQGKTNKLVVELRAGDWGNKPVDVKNLPRAVSGRVDFTQRPGFNPRASGRIIKPWVISGGSGGEAFFSLGMWQGVRLEIVPKVHLERPYLVTKSATVQSSVLHLSTEIFWNEHSLSQVLHPWHNTQIRHPDERGVRFVPVKERLTVLVELLDQGQKKLSKEFPLTIYEGRNWLEEDITIANPKLWNPTGLGQPNLYQVQLSLKRNGKVIDRHAFDYGIRMIERIPSAGPRLSDRYEDWQFIINGKKVFVKGMNFTPQDILLETSEERYRWTLSAAKEMGVQLIRIWGGGLLETNTLYKICNELGIMVWQDFPIGNQDTPGYPQDIWEAQVVQNIFRLRNHPSLVIWCGGNEFNPYSYGNAASIGILERNLQTFDKSRLFVRTTPDQGSIHIYPDMDPTWYNRSYGKEAWISETGMHSMPEPSLFYETVNAKEFTGLGRMWDTAFAAAHPEFIHHFTEYGPSRVPRMLSRASHIDNMNDPSIESVSEATQIGAGEFYQVVSEKMQGNYPVTAGLMPWVFKRHWPVIAIQMMDWFGHAGAPYYFLKRTYEPTHIAIDVPRLLWAPGEQMKLDIKITNAVFRGDVQYKASVKVYDEAFKLLFASNKPVTVANGTSVSKLSLDSFRFPANSKDKFVFLVADLHDAKGSLVSRSFYYPRCLSMMEDKSFYDKYLNEPIAWVTLDKGPWLKPAVAKSSTTLALEVLADKKISDNQNKITVRVKNTGTVPSFMTKLDIVGMKRAFYASDNYMWIAPGETKEIEVNVLWREEAKAKKVTVAGWNTPVAEKLLTQGSM